MGELVRFESKQGGAVLVEVVDPVNGRAPVTRGGGHAAAVMAEAGESLEQVLGKLGPVVQGIVSEPSNARSGETSRRNSTAWIPDMARSPPRTAPPGTTTVIVGFAVKISADSNVIIARAGGEANFRVCMRWSKDASP